MGLDITAYSRLSKVADPVMEDECPVDWENQFHAHPASMSFTEENWPGRSAGVESGAVYTFAKKFGFRAGSYSGYGEWRRMLAAFAGVEDIDEAWREPKEGPFIELINFANNEGIIGPTVAAKLAKDFAEHQARADDFGDDDGDWWREQYAKWRQAFEMAADGGAVEFH